MTYRWHRLALLTCIATASTGCAYVAWRADGGLTAPEWDAEHATVGVGVGAWNDRGRVGANLAYAYRSKESAILLEAQADAVLFQRRRERVRSQPVYLDERMAHGLAVTTRAAVGPAFGDASTAIEGSLGLGYFQSLAQKNRAYDETYYFYSLIALEAFATRMYGTSEVRWVGGVRLSLTLPGDLYHIIFGPTRSGV